MSTSTIIWIVIAVVAAVLLIAALTVVARNGRNRRRRADAERIREQARVETTKVERREALADETAARARAAHAEAEAKAAEAARLQERAAAHHSEAASSRDQLDEQWQQADRIDPAARTAEGRTTDQDQGLRDDVGEPARGAHSAPLPSDAPRSTAREEAT
jgi:FtsZ-interacting cell division protein ZipA